MVALSAMLPALASLACAGSAAPARVDLFAPNEGNINFPCYRQPALIAADAEGTQLLAFAEGRIGYTPGANGTCAPALEGELGAEAGVREVGGLLTRISRDSGKTWSDSRYVFGNASTTGPNIDFYTLVRDDATNRLFLVLQERSKTLFFTSDDAGETWDGPITMDLPVPPSPYKSRGPAVGHGVQITKGQCAADGGCAEAGRLIVPFYCQDGKVNHACLVYSDDGGAIWQWGGFGQADSRESQVVQTSSAGASASLYANMRNFGKSPGHRMTASSTDAGSTFSDYATDAFLTEPVTSHWKGVVASVIGVQDSNGDDVLVFSDPGRSDERAQLTLRTSRDAGKTWAKSRVLWQGGASYSDMQVMPGGVGVIYENGDATFADRISFSYVPLAWIEADNGVVV